MIAVCSVTHYSVHSPTKVWRHVLDWRLQTDQRYRISLAHDGLVEGREDRVSIEDLEYGANEELIIYPERRKFYGAYCRKDWLDKVDPKQYPYIYMCCADDQISPVFVERVMGAILEHPDADFIGIELSHHHYNYNVIPLGTFPTVNHADWSSYVVKTEIAKKVGINFPEEYAADGIFMGECFNYVTGAKVINLKSTLVFKN